MIVVTGSVVARPDSFDEVRRLSLEHVHRSRKEPGCIMYLVHRHKTEPRRFFVYEQYKDDAALEAHRAAPHFLQYAKKELPKCGDRVEGNLYAPLD